MLYDIAFLLFALFYLPALLFKGKLHKDFLQRFGIYDRMTLERICEARGTIWIQAVSVGEVALCRTLIPLLKKEYPQSRIVLSTITKTGNDLARRLFSEDAAIIYFPLDFSFIAKKAVGLIRPKIYIMIETEIWPNLLAQLTANLVPAILINGRISDRSFGKYRLAAPFLKNTLNRINLFCMQSEIDAERIKAMGAPAARVSVTGNMKFDIGTSATLKPPADIRRSLGLEDGEALFVAGSTHEGEEDILLDVFKQLEPEFQKLRLMIAPRHIERAREAEGIVRKFGYEPGREIRILDTIGQLNDIYSIAEIVFIGGSLVRHGGQNPIEPACFEKPILFGPHMFNFKDIASIFLDKHAAVLVADGKELLKEMKKLLRDEGRRRTLGMNAKKAVLENRGATARNLNAIKKLYA